MKRILMAWAGLLVLLPIGRAEQTPSPLESYRTLEFPPTQENFDKGWKDRVACEFEIINREDPERLRDALKDPDPFVRSIAARALGIRADKAAAEMLADLVKTDPEYMVRIRAVEALGLLKRKPEAIEKATNDRDGAVWWSARMAAGQLQSDTDYAALVRQAYAAGIERDDMGSAKLGQPAPDFTALTSDGKPFQLSSVLGQKPVILYFAAVDS